MSSHQPRPIDLYFHRDRCPICGAPSAAAKLVMRSRPTAESLPCEALSDFRSGYGSRRVFFSYYRCDACGGLYCPTYFTPAQLEALYRHQPENMGEVPLAAREATARAYFDTLRRHDPLEGEYLELGPDIGLLAHLCAESGRFARFHLFEPNRNVHAILAARLAGRNIQLSSAADGSDPLPEGSVSTAVAIHVIDHLVEPTRVLRRLHAALRRSGLLFIATHDEASFLARVLGRRWPPYALQHPQLFTPRSMARLLEGCGFEIIESKPTVNYFPATYLVRSLFTVLGMDPVAPRYEHPFMIRLTLGNFVTVARRV